jgi:hypothetical protein
MVVIAAICVVLATPPSWNSSVGLAAKSTGSTQSTGNSMGGAALPTMEALSLMGEAQSSTCACGVTVPKRLVRMTLGSATDCPAACSTSTRTGTFLRSSSSVHWSVAHGKQLPPGESLHVLVRTHTPGSATAWRPRGAVTAWTPHGVRENLSLRTGASTTGRGVESTSAGQAALTSSSSLGSAAYVALSLRRMQ